MLNFTQWIATPLGEYVGQWQQQHFDLLTADIFGRYAVQLGCPAIDCLRASRMQYVRYALIESEVAPIARKPDLIINFEELPFASQSIDLIVLPHGLEQTENPHQLLREIERVLIPEGHLLISGFNPASLWYMQKFLIRKQAALLPEQEQSIHLLRLKDWLRLLGFTMDRGYFGCYAPLCKTSRWIERWSFMEKAGNRWWPFAGAVYMLQAIKRVRGMHLIGPAWRNKRLRNRLAIPATHSSHSVSNNKNHD